MPTKSLYSLNHRLLRLLSAAARGVEYLKPILRHWIASATLITISMLGPVQAEQPVGSQADTPAKPAYPASMQTFQIPSHGALLNAFVYVAAGAGPHPAVVLLHGFPGNERNLDLAQDIRRAGWDVLYFNYRGSWGSPGDFSFSHAIEDTTASACLRQPEMTKLLRLDPSRIVLIGHSMGDFMAVQGAAADPAIIAFGLISAADLGGRIDQPLSKEGEQVAIQRLSAGYARDPANTPILRRTFPTENVWGIL